MCAMGHKSISGYAREGWALDTTVRRGGAGLMPEPEDTSWCKESVRQQSTSARLKRSDLHLRVDGRSGTRHRSDRCRGRNCGRSTNSSVTDLLPTTRNIKIWGGEEDLSCNRCGAVFCTLNHILTGCPKALAEGRYRWRHDKVLMEIAKWVEQQRVKANNK